MTYLVAVAVLAADQILKWLVRSHMIQQQLVPVFPPALYLDYIRNPGGAFGIFPHARWLFVLVAIAVIAAVVYVQRRFRLTLWSRLALGLVLGGALGNLVDRMWTGLVVDYVYFRPINFPVFNLADVCIDVGIGLLILGSMWADRVPRGRRSTEDTNE